MRRQTGFTLIEIAIVLVIIGLLLGGVLKGQELITSARVRNLISQQDGIKAAYFGFLDRFRALPGDYSQASTNIANVAAGANGNGNGQIRTVSWATPSTNTSRRGTTCRMPGSSTAAIPTRCSPKPPLPCRQPLRPLHPVIYDAVYGTGARSAAPQHQDRQRDSVRTYWPKSTARSTTAIRWAAYSSSRPTTAARAAPRRRAARPASATRRGLDRTHGLQLRRGEPV